VRGSRDIEHESSAHSLATVQVLKATTSSTSRPDQRTIRANLPSVSRRRCVGRRSDGYLSRPIPATEAEPSPRSKMQVRTKLAQVGQGAILGTYLWWGGPAGPLGFPVSQEEDADGEVVQYFEYGEIWWHPVDGATIDIY